MKTMKQMMDEQRKEMQSDLDNMEQDVMTMVQEKFEKMRQKIDSRFGIENDNPVNPANPIMGVPPLGNAAGSQN